MCQQSPYLTTVRAINLKRYPSNSSRAGIMSPMMGYIVLCVRPLCTRRMSLTSIHKLQLILSHRFIICL
ncbi:hypothetical protein NKDENANG_00276 [Candidatus Entotheonellaceae bacterium PAL068K]